MHSKSQVRWSGPLEPFAAGLDAELARLGYTPAGTRRKLEAAAHLSQWLVARGMTAGDTRSRRLACFPAGGCGRCPTFTRPLTSPRCRPRPGNSGARCAPRHMPSS